MNSIFATLETHPFATSKSDDFRCGICSKPRALHTDDGFHPHFEPPLPPDTQRIRTANIGGTIVGAPLTDKKIARYEQDGWYSEAFREARRARMNAKRKGNFIERDDGRLIYQPI